LALEIVQIVGTLWD